MLYSTACEYGIRALTHLAERKPRDYLRLREVARAEGIPYPFLAKIFQELVSAGLLRSARGRTGGYTLAHPAGEITLYDIKAAIDGVAELEQCAVGLGRCSDEMPCPQHDSFKPIREQIKRYLQRTTLADMARALARKRALLSEVERPAKERRGSREVEEAVRGRS
ncbi:MAG: Rrf2 family transcriptional regulator [Gemmatimonadetes bacterium]|nr:Rrf2 family transcriptional regulator [Gemmatimonadota bacterium]